MVRHQIIVKNPKTKPSAESVISDKPSVKSVGNFWNVPEMQEIEGLRHEKVDAKKKLLLRILRNQSNP